MGLPKSVMIYEEGPREGFQIEKTPIATDDKVRLIDALSETGVKHIQVGSFVDPRRVPSMADVDKIVERMKVVPGIEYCVLWMNERGMRKALEYPQLSVDGKLRLYWSETFLKMNMGRTPEQHAQKNVEMITLCKNHNVPITQAALNSAFGCNYQGDVSIDLLVKLLDGALELTRANGVELEELIVADTMAWGTPEAVRRIVGTMQDKFPQLEIRLHLHDTRGLGLANAYAGLQMGVQRFDSCVAGLGGCPFAKHKGAAGNICTEDFVLMCEEMGIETGVNLEAMIAAANLAEQIIGHAVPSHSAKGGALSEIRTRVKAGVTAAHAAQGAALRPALDGVRVLDLSNVLAGPLASYALALLGAEVIKVERPGTGDLARKMGAHPELGKALMGASFLSTNSNKKSITLNLQSAKGKEILQELVADADVLLENFRPGTMERLGLGYDVLKARNPRIVYCAVSGFGQEGPLAQRAAYDQIIQGFCGLMSLTGSPQAGPTRAGFTVCDSSSAITAAMAILAALYRARATGVGTMIDVSMLDSSLALASWIVSNFVNAGAIPKPMGNQNHSAVPSGAFQTKEGLLNLVCNEDKQFEAFCDAIERPDLKTHEVWGSRFERLKRREEFHEIIKPVLMRRTAAEWETYFAKRQVPSGRIYSIPEIVQHPQVEQRGFISHLDVPGIADGIKVPGLGFKFDGEDMSPKSPPPRLGEDTDAVLSELGYKKEQIEELRAARVV